MKQLLTLLAFTFFGTSAFAQIPNPGFESWDTFATYKSPKGWDNLDSVTNLVSVYTCERDSPAFAGNYYMKLTSKTTPLGVAPGVAVSGKINYTTYAPKSGFPMTTRPKSITGAYQYMVFGSSPGFIMVFLSKWNTTTGKRDTVAFVNKTLTGMEMNWKAFSIDLKYYLGSAPDSAIIVLSASGAAPANKDYLWVDTLAFSGSVPVGTITLNADNVNTRPASLSVYPNPAKGFTNITYVCNTEKDITINISDLNGRTVKTVNTHVGAGNSTVPVSTNSFQPGVYFIRTVTDESVEEQKLIIE